MPRLFIPTRNRPTSLQSVLTWLARFYPGTGVVVADGSSEDYKARNRAAVEAAGSGLTIDYRAYPAEFPYFARILEVLESLDDEALVFGADDEFPMMEVFEAGEQHLQRHPDCVAVMGASLFLSQMRPDRLSVRLNPARSLLARSPIARARRFMDWPVATSYALTRRGHLLERYRRAQECFLAGIYDYVLGVHDALRGSVAAIPAIAFLSTRNYNHSYLRPGDKLFFVRQSDLILKTVDRLREDLLVAGVADEPAAARLADLLVRGMIAERCGTPAHLRRGFRESPAFLEEGIGQQLALFQGLFTADSPVRRRYEEKLAFVAEAMRRNIASDDNGGEPRQYRTLEAQERPPEAGAGARTPPPSGRGLEAQHDESGVTMLLDPTTWLRLEGAADSPVDGPAAGPTSPAPTASPPAGRLEEALRVLGESDRSRQELVALLQRHEARERAAAPFGSDLREGVTGPILDAAVGQGRRFVKRLESGLSLVFHYRSKIARDFLLSDAPAPDHVWEPQTTRTLLELGRDARQAVIGGAYFGDQAVPLAERLRGRGTVHCFELSAENADLLTHNARRNGLDNLVVNRLGLWSDARVRLALVGEDAYAAPREAPAGFAATTLEAYAEAQGLEGIDLVMLDIEGGELAALRGGRRFLEQPAEQAPQLVFEIHGAYTDWSNGIAETEIVRFLAVRGYTLFAIRDYQSNVAMAGRPVELVELDSIVTAGPVHGFNMLGTKRPEALDPAVFRRVRGVSPKLLFGRDPVLHAPLS